MLISETVMVRWNGFTSKRYMDKGYKKIKQGKFFECKVKDLLPGSTTKVLVDCDYKEDGCKGIHEKPYRQYTEDKENGLGNCCTNKKCGASKSREIFQKKFGVDNYQQLSSSRKYASEMRKTPFKKVQQDFAEKGLELLSNKSDYQNDRSRLFFICNNHKKEGIQETNYANIKKNKGCCTYGKGKLCANSNKLDGNIVYQAFVEKGVIPKFNPEDYKKNNQLLPFICPDHVKQEVQYRNYATLIVSQHKCNYCSQEFTNESLRIDRNRIKKYYESRDLILEDINEYENKDKPIKFRCVKHLQYIQQVCYSGLKNTKIPCEYCRAENSLSKLNRNLRSSLSQWKKNSKKSCNNKCIFTGNKNFEIHHLQSFNAIIKEALEILNLEAKDKYTGEEYINIKSKVVELHNKYPLGVCIFNRIHVLFHQLYSKEATIEDFYEFKKRYELGEFIEVLKEVG